MRWILASTAAAAGLSLVLVAPMVDVVSAYATAPVASQSQLLVPPTGTPSGTSDGYSGYYENLVGPLTLSSTITVPTAKCTNTSTWATQIRLLAVIDSQTGSGNVGEHGGGVEIGCTKTGSPSYAAALCDPSLSSDLSYSGGCDSLTDPVAPGDAVTVTVTASGGCDPTCSSVATTVNDTETWSKSAASASNSDFDTFVAVVGVPPLMDFGKVTVSRLSVSGAGFGGQKTNLVDLAGHTLARAGRLTKGRSSFTLKWVRAD